MFPIFILALIVPQSLAGLLSQPHCQDVKAVEKLNITAFGSGVWYEIARYPNIFEILDRCVSVENSHHGNVVNMKLRNVPFNSIYSIESNVEYADAKESGDLSVSLKYGWPFLHLEFPAKVLAIDYDQYAIYYACFFEKNTGLQREYAWIFSRTETLEGSAKREVDEFLRSSNAIDVKKLIWIDHTSTFCKVGSFVGNLPNKFLGGFKI